MIFERRQGLNALGIEFPDFKIELDEITKKVQAEAKKRKVTTLSTKAQILSHAKYRIGRGIKIKDDSVTVTK